MKICPKCKAINNDNASSCYHCGENINDNSSKIELKECLICHELNDSTRDTCIKCHSSLNFKVYNAVKNSPEDASYNFKSNKPTCIHCGTYSNQLTNGLCPNCNKSKLILRISLYILISIIYGFMNATVITLGKRYGAIATVLILGSLMFIAELFIKSEFNSNSKGISTSDFKRDTCKHCGKKINIGNILCNKCRIKRALLISASVPIAFLVCFSFILGVDILLIYFFKIKLGWGLKAILMFSSFLGFARIAEKLIFKPKYSKKSKLENTNFSNRAENKRDKTFCTRCGNILDENKKCTSCGKQYFYPKRFINKMVPKYCKVCGGIIDKNTKRCTKCNKQYHLSSKIILSVLLIIISVAVVTLSISLISKKINFTPNVEKTYSNDIVVLKSEYVYPGKKAYVEINGKPNTEYRITVTYGDGYVQQTNVSPKTTNPSGNTGWRWYVPLNSFRGDCNIYIESDYEYTNTTISVQ